MYMHFATASHIMFPFMLLLLMVLRVTEPVPNLGFEALPRPGLRQLAESFHSCEFTLLYISLLEGAHADEITNIALAISSVETAYSLYPTSKLKSFTMEFERAGNFELQSHSSANFLRKHLLCLTVLLPWTVASVPKSFYNLGRIASLLIAVEEPKFVITLCDSNFLYEQVINNGNVHVVPRLHQISIKAIYIFIFLESSAFLYRIPCSNDAVAAPPCNHFVSLQRVERVYVSRLYRLLHGNLAGSYVAVSGMYPLDGKTCEGDILRGFSPYLHSCLLPELAKALNFTPMHIPGGIFARPLPAVVSTVTAGFLLDPRYLVGIIGRKSIDFTLLSSCIVYNDYGFIQVVPEQRESVLLNALDLKTWLVVIASAIAISVACTIALSERLTDFRCSVLKAMLKMSFATLLEIFYLPSGVAKLLDLKTVLMLTLWAFVGKLISNSYQAGLYSMLTTPASVGPPTSVEDIVNFPGLVASDMFYTVQTELSDPTEKRVDGNNDVVAQMPHFSKLDYEMERIIRSSRNNSSTSRVLRQMKERHFFIHEDVSNLTLYRFEKPSVPVTIMAVNGNGKRKITWPPKEYILIGRRNDIKMYNILVRLTGAAGGKVVLAGDMMSPLSGGWVTPILVQSNFLAPRVALMTSRIMESGIWTFWRELQELRLSVQVFKQLKGYAQSTSNGVAANIWAVAFDSKDYDRLREQMRSQYQPLSITVLMALFLWFVLGLSVALISMVLEYDKELLAALFEKLLRMTGLRT